MKAQRQFEAMLNKYGQRATVYSKDGATGSAARAFIQPLLSEKQSLHQHSPTPLGRRRTDRFLYLGERGIAIEAGVGCCVQWGEERFSVQMAHPVYIGGEILHWWAVLIPQGEVME